MLAGPDFSANRFDTGMNGPVAPMLSTINPFVVFGLAIGAWVPVALIAFAVLG
jgi:hypothetical protein